VEGFGMSAPVGTGRALGVSQSNPQLDGLSFTTGSTLGFYGVSQVAQPSGATQATITATWVTISSGFGFLTSDQIISVIDQLKQIAHVLKTLGLWKGSA
jgi:hypothetical protein